MDELFGFIESILFSNEENGYTVAKIKVPRWTDLITIVGSLPSVQPGEKISCKGNWKMHPQFGKQFEVSEFSLELPKDRRHIERYLASGLIKGIGPSFAKKIVDEFGDETLDILDKSPLRLHEVQGLGEKRIDTIIEHWLAQRSIRNLMIYLQSKDIRISLAHKIFKLYGEKSIEKIEENPYDLAKQIFGIGFKTADDLALKIGIPSDSPFRLQSALQFTLWELTTDGHVCYPKEGLIEKVAEKLSVEKSLVDQAFQTIVSTGEIIEESIGDVIFSWIRPLYISERGIALELSRLLHSPLSIRAIQSDKAVEWAEEQMGISFAPEQSKAVSQSTTEKCMILTGGPGTGKSTITKAILRIHSKLTGKIILAAPTGRAAKRMSEITLWRSQTIHSLLEYDFTTMKFRKNRENPLDVDLIIIDEASMIDTQLMYHLLKAIPDRAKMILIGDVDQLPSVGPGNVLADLINSSMITTVRLSRIFRQGKGSNIVLSAHRVNEGHFPLLESSEEGDFWYFDIESPSLLMEKMLTLITRTLPEKFLFHPIDDIQVLCPMKRGPLGSEMLNITLQEKLNPSDRPFERMGMRLHEGDKVMQIKNNYTKNVFNGDIGRVHHIDKESMEISVIYDDQKEVFYDFTEIDELMLSYAVSIHKYQGSECPCVILPIHTSHFKLLYKNLLYTGITRGKRLVVLMGTKKAIAIAVKNVNTQNRFTGLAEKLQQSITRLSESLF